MDYPHGTPIGWPAMGDATPLVSDECRCPQCVPRAVTYPMQQVDPMRRAAVEAGYISLKDYVADLTKHVTDLTNEQVNTVRALHPLQAITDELPDPCVAQAADANKAGIESAPVSGPDHRTDQCQQRGK